MENQDKETLPMSSLVAEQNKTGKNCTEEKGREMSISNLNFSKTA